MLKMVTIAIALVSNELETPCSPGNYFATFVTVLAVPWLSNYETLKAAQRLGS